jgi:hypothetical protein
MTDQDLPHAVSELRILVEYLRRRHQISTGPSWLSADCSNDVSVELLR